MIQRRALLLAGSAYGLSVAASALAQGRREAVPDEVAQALPGALWSGSARLRFWGIDVYDARLWVAPGFTVERFDRHGLALELTYLRDLSRSAIAERSLAEMRRAGDIRPELAQRWQAALLDAVPEVRAVERLTGLHQPGVGALFWHNGRPRPAVPDPEFSRLFFGIWLSQATSEQQMRSALLSRLPP